MSEDPALAALKAKTLALTYRCPKGMHPPQCPFGVLKGLSHESRQTILERMSGEELVKLFDLAGPCACPGDPRIEARG